MSGQHTPGPWGVIHDEYCGHYRIESGSEAIANVFYVNNAPDDRGFADSRLIAAAPDLLEALEGARRFIVRNAAYAESVRLESLRKVDAVIAKARGQS